MKPTEITMQIVHSLGNFETCRLEAKFTLDDSDELDKAFKSARRQLENAYRTAYGIKTEKTEKSEKSEKSEKRTLDVNSQKFEMICSALYDGRTNLKELDEYYTLDSDIIFHLKEKKLI